MAFGTVFLTLAACSGSPETSETGSGGTTAATETGTGTTSTSTTAPTTGTTSDATEGETTTTTTGGPDGAMFCEERCMVDADCAIDGDESVVSCKDNRCVYDDRCVIDQDCLFGGPVALRKCASQADCVASVCVDVGGGIGYCALTADDPAFCEIVAEKSMVAMYPPIEGGAAVPVCTFPEFVCKDGECFDPCESDDDCFFRIHPTCDVNTGMCICTSDANCKSDPQFNKSVCIAGECGCGSDADCQGDDFDRCYEGRCGCSSVAACASPPLHDGTIVVCE
ncbi:MAG: hypothetical protein R3B09_06620 [Nannocystaceae bacterium]